MSALANFVIRNNKMFFRNRMQVFFSVLSIIILIGLYAIFLQKLQVDSIAEMAKQNAAIKTLVNEWMIAGVLSIIPVTSTLGAYSLYVQDNERKILYDFLTTPMSRHTIQFSYMLSAFQIGLFMTLIAFIGCEIFLVATGGEWLSFTSLLKVLGVLVLAVFLSSVMMFFFTLIVKNSGTFSAFTSIVSTMIGFLCGVYVPMGVLPVFVQKVVEIFPISHTTVLLRQLFMEPTLPTVFGNMTANKESYMRAFGGQYEVNGAILTMAQSTGYVIFAIVVFTLISLVIYRLKNK